MYFPSSGCCFVSVTSKYSLQWDYLIIKHFQSRNYECVQNLVRQISKLNALEILFYSPSSAMLLQLMRVQNIFSGKNKATTILLRPNCLTCIRKPYHGYFDNEFSNVAYAKKRPQNLKLFTRKGHHSCKQMFHIVRYFELMICPQLVWPSNNVMASVCTVVNPNFS
jgi:hypothetical protein